MENLNSCTLPWVYQSYCEWFADHARSDAAPKKEEEIVDAHSYSEDVFDDGHVMLSRMVYYVPLKASEAKSGRPEMFGFMELNLMELAEDGEVEALKTVEYALL